MYGVKGNVDESQVCLQCVCVCGWGMCSCRHALLYLQPKDTSCWLVYSLRDRGRCRTSSDPSVRNRHGAKFIQARGGNGEVRLSREREGRNYDISIARCRQELNICSEASSNIIQERGVNGVICYPCVPSGREEERQRTCSHHRSILLITLHTLRKVAASVSVVSTVPLLF